MMMVHDHSLCRRNTLTPASTRPTGGKGVCACHRSGKVLDVAREAMGEFSAGRHISWEHTGLSLGFQSSPLPLRLGLSVRPRFTMSSRCWRHLLQLRAFGSLPPAGPPPPLPSPPPPPTAHMPVRYYILSVPFGLLCGMLLQQYIESRHEQELVRQRIRELAQQDAAAAACGNGGAVNAVPIAK